MKTSTALLTLATAAALAMSSNAKDAADPLESTITKASFGKLEDGTEVQLYTLTNKNGMVVKITNYGGIVTYLTAPDKDGKWEDVVLGYNKVEDYVAGSPYFGCITGRYANRIAKGKFSIGGEEYTLATNNDPNHLHGGDVGFDKKVWSVEEIKGKQGVGLKLSYTSPDGEEGYPGTLKTTVTYLLTEDDALDISYTATTDKATAINLTHHSYFNLAGEDSGETILDHELTLNCDHFVATDDTGIPLGGIQKVEDTVFDFRKATAIGKRIGADDEQIKNGKGYDHNWVINGEGMRLAATLHDPDSGRTMEVHTDQPGIQFYTGNYLDGTNVGKSGKAYEHRTGLCLETQVHPDSPNQKGYPDAILEPGDEYSHRCIYKFSAK